MKKVIMGTMVLLCLLISVNVSAQCLGTIFTDVNQSTVGEMFCEYIERFSTLGITTGYPDGTYRPFNNTNRQQMAAFIMRTIDNVITAGSCPEGSSIRQILEDGSVICEIDDGHVSDVNPVPAFVGTLCWDGTITDTDPDTPFESATFPTEGTVTYIGGGKYRIMVTVDMSGFVIPFPLPVIFDGSAVYTGTQILMNMQFTQDLSPVSQMRYHGGGQVALDPSDLSGSGWFISRHYTPASEPDPLLPIGFSDVYWQATFEPTSCSE